MRNRDLLPFVLIVAFGTTAAAQIAKKTDMAPVVKAVPVVTVAPMVMAMGAPYGGLVFTASFQHVDVEVYENYNSGRALRVRLNDFGPTPARVKVIVGGAPRPGAYPIGADLQADKGTMIISQGGVDVQRCPFTPAATANVVQRCLATISFPGSNEIVMRYDGGGNGIAYIRDFVIGGP